MVLVRLKLAMMAVCFVQHAMKLATQFCTMRPAAPWGSIGASAALRTGMLGASCSRHKPGMAGVIDAIARVMDITPSPSGSSVLCAAAMLDIKVQDAGRKSDQTDRQLD